jgi:hypothetical protein
VEFGSLTKSRNPSYRSSLLPRMKPAKKWQGSSILCPAVSQSCLLVFLPYNFVCVTYYVTLVIVFPDSLFPIISITFHPRLDVSPSHLDTNPLPRYYHTSQKLKPHLLTPIPHTTCPLRIGVDSVWSLIPIPQTIKSPLPPSPTSPLPRSPLPQHPSTSLICT